VKKLIKKILPQELIRLYRKLRNSHKNSLFYGKSAEDTFKHIYLTNHWRSNESISGTGSEESQTEIIITSINSLLRRMKIESVLDIPCGDFNWMKKIDLSCIKYVGADIVEDIVTHNSNKIKINSDFKFVKLNLINDHLPQSDLIINRDCLVHLSFEDIYNSLKNIKSSGCKYILTTTFPDHLVNEDIVTGDWRTLNLEKSPFNFPAPRLLINENCTESNGLFKDKSLGLWVIEDIKLPLNVYK